MAEEWEDLTRKAQFKNLKRYSAVDLHERFKDKENGFFITQKKISEIIPYEKDGATKNSNILKNPPDKEIIRHRGLVISPEVAILEFLDNIFDNYMKNVQNDVIDHVLEIELVFYSTEDDKYLIIRENSGGIKNEDLRPLLIMGTSTSEGNHKVGTWGEALLNSIRSLGINATIYSKHPNGKALKILIKEEFFQPGSEWRIEYFIFDSFSDLKNIDSGMTIFRIKGISSKFSTNEKKNFEELLSLIQDTYWMKVSEIRKIGLDVKLTIDYYSSEILQAKFTDIDFDNIYSHYPFASPIYLEKYKIPVSLDNSKTSDIIVDVYCGLNPSIRKKDKYTKYRGVWMWGNDRLFASNLNDINVGYGLNETGIPLIKNRYFSGMLAIFLFFKSKNPAFNQFIPWRIPTKNGYNTENVIKSEILELIKLVVERFINPIKNLKGPLFQFQLYSSSFINLPEEEKVKLIKDSYKSEMSEDLDNTEINDEFYSFIHLKIDDLAPIERYDVTEIKDLKEQNKILSKGIKDFDKALKKGADTLGFFSIFLEVLQKAELLPLYEEEIEEIEEKFKEELEDHDIQPVLIDSNDEQAIESSTTQKELKIQEANKESRIEVKRREEGSNKPEKLPIVEEGVVKKPISKKIERKKIEVSSKISKNIVKQVKEKEPLVKVSFSIEKAIITKLRNKYNVDSKKRPGTVVKEAIKKWSSESVE